jgi:hypothetical protein
MDVSTLCGAACRWQHSPRTPIISRVSEACLFLHIAVEFRLVITDTHFTILRYPADSYTWDRACYFRVLCGILNYCLILSLSRMKKNEIAKASDLYGAENMLGGSEVNRPL